MMTQKYKPVTYRYSKSFNGVRVEISVREETLKELGITMEQFFTHAKKHAELQSETFHNLLVSGRADG